MMPEFATQADTAEWMGTTVDQMNEEHDDIHQELCDMYGVKSHSLACRDSEPFDQQIAWHEEEAVLYVQRWLNTLHNKGEFK
jgi:hypothetical protein